MKKKPKSRRMPPPQEVKLGQQVHKDKEDNGPELAECIICGLLVEEFSLEDGVCEFCLDEEITDADFRL